MALSTYIDTISILGFLKELILSDLLEKWRLLGSLYATLYALKSNAIVQKYRDNTIWWNTCSRPEHFKNSSKLRQERTKIFDDIVVTKSFCDYL